MTAHTLPAVTLNSFLEDTSVVIATAFLLVRGPFERMLTDPVVAGLVCGLLAASEAIFPSARFPYASHTLVCAFATSVLGWRAGALAATVGAVFSLAVQPVGSALVTAVQLTVTVFVVSSFPRTQKLALPLSIVSVALAQCVSVASAAPTGVRQASLTSLWTVPANTFGFLLLGVVIRDARTRRDAERHRQEVAQAKTLAVEKELLMLRGRVHPHFLYNALTSIAALCELSPRRASKAAINLGSLMRHSLERDVRDRHPLGEELSIVMSYAEVEMERFGGKLQVNVDIAGCETVGVPPFAVQILVENAILHGVSARSRGGRVDVLARKKTRFAYVAVADDGKGLPNHSWRPERLHGLGILSELMLHPSSNGGRLRLARRPSGGTLAVLRLSLDDWGAQ